MWLLKNWLKLIQGRHGIIKRRSWCITRLRPSPRYAYVKAALYWNQAAFEKLKNGSYLWFQVDWAKWEHSGWAIQVEAFIVSVEHMKRHYLLGKTVRLVRSLWGTIFVTIWFIGVLDFFVIKCRSSDEGWDITWISIFSCWKGEASLLEERVGYYYWWLLWHDTKNI